MRRPVGNVTLFVLGVATLLLSVRFTGPRLFLYYKVGWTRVHAEHIRMTMTPNGGPWPLSNGEAIRDGFFIEFLMVLACWFATFYGALGLVLLVSRFVRRPRPP